MTEHQIQTFLWENRERWEDLIDHIEMPDKYIFDADPDAIFLRTPEKILFNQLIERYTEQYERLFGLNLFGCEVPLKRDKDSTIRADLLGTVVGVSGIAILEIKKSAQTERQAFTELFAYASHLHGIFPTLNDDDIHYVLISPMRERIVREAAILSFLFDEKPVFAYIPVYENDDVTTLRLKPWMPDFAEISKISEAAFSYKNVEIFKVTWPAIDDWNPKKGNPTEAMKARMNKIASYAAQLMESKKIHGFVFTSQAYPELPLLSNAITVAGLNPFKIAKDNYLLTEQKLPANQLTQIGDEEINLLHIIPELASKAGMIHEEENYLHKLIASWTNTLIGIAFDTVNTMTSSTKDDFIELDWGGMNWQQYQVSLLEDILRFNYDVHPTGLLRRLFTAYTAEDFAHLRKFGPDHHPYLGHGDVPRFMADYLNEQGYFRKFLDSLFHDEDDNIEH